jgi:hypothetical protein
MFTPSSGRTHRPVVFREGLAMGRQHRSSRDPSWNPDWEAAMAEKDQHPSGEIDWPEPSRAPHALPGARLALASLAAAAVLLGGAIVAHGQTPPPPTAGASQAAPDQGGFQEEFNLAGRRLAATGESRYWILRPGYQAVFASDDTTLTVRLLDETREVAGVVTRVVEEREVKDGQLHEVARNFYAISTSGRRSTSTRTGRSSTTPGRGWPAAPTARA